MGIFLRAVVVLLLLAFQAVAAVPERPRTVQLLSEGWRFTKGDPQGAEQASFDDRAWRAVTVPHDYSIEGPVARDNPSGPAGGFFPGGIAWYRSTLQIAKIDDGKRRFIVFDGVMANSDVWINGHHLGRRPNGYVSFVYDLTAYLRPGANVIAVRCDNDKEPSLRWYLGAGIYRQVRLVTTGDTHIAPWGTFVTTPVIADAQASVHVRSSVSSPAGGTLALAVALTGPDGKVAPAVTGKQVVLKAGQSADLELDASVLHPQRWDTEHPAMYTARVTLLRNGKPVDSEDVPFGIRSASFDASTGFFLNGRSMKIYGVGLHADGGALGAAVPLAVWKQRLLELRKLGVNAIRTAHNAAAPEFLDLCDRMGLLVLDEFFDMWTLPKVPYDYSLFFKEWAERDTADLVRRDRNHPSVILYSVGNEIRDTTVPAVAAEWLKRLIRVHHENDPTRPITQALFRPNVSKDYDNGYADLLDIVGQNYREKEILAAHAQNPARRIIGTENTHEVSQWIALRDNQAYAGQFLWTGVDYLGEAGRWPTIGTGSGLLLTTGLQRPRAFERQSWWTSTPMVRIARRVSTVGQAVVEPVFGPGGAPADQPAQAAATARPRFSQTLVADWTPASLAPHEELLEIYTNADEVDIMLNGQIVATKARNANATPILVKLPFVAGTLTALAKRDGVVIASDVLRTAGKPARIGLSLESDSRSLSRHIDDVALVSATLFDAAGTRIPDSTMRVTFRAQGAGQIVAVDNGDLMDHAPFQASARTLYDGHAIAIVRATGDTGSVTVTVSAPGLPDGVLTIPVKAGHPLVPLRSF